MLAGCSVEPAGHDRHKINADTLHPELGSSNVVRCKCRLADLFLAERLCEGCRWVVRSDVRQTVAFYTIDIAELRTTDADRTAHRVVVQSNC